MTAREGEGMRLMDDRISTSDAKRNIEKAFDGWLNSLSDDETDDPDNLGEEAQELNATHASVAAFLKQVEGREAVLMEALRACQACAESVNDKEADRAKRLAKDVIGRYGVPGGMHAN